MTTSEYSHNDFPFLNKHTQAAGSVAGMMITTEAMVTDIPKDDAPMPPMPDMGGMGGMGGMM